MNNKCVVMIIINRRGGFTPPRRWINYVCQLSMGVEEHLNKVSCYEIQIKCKSDSRGPCQF